MCNQCPDPSKPKIVDFVHLHCHSHFSLLDGLSSPEKLVESAQKHHFGSIGLTDHGTCAGLFSFQKACNKQGIKPIMGCELYISPDHKSREKGSPINHLLLTAKNEIGLKNLYKLTSIAEMEGKYYKPRIDFDLLTKHHEGLICTSGCPASPIQVAITERKDSLAESLIGQYRELFKDDFYIEVMAHKYFEAKKDQEKSEIYNAKKLIEFSKKMGIKAVATNDVHYADKTDWEYHDVLLAMQTHDVVKNPDRFSFQSDDFYIKSYEEMYARYKSYPDLLLNTMEIAEKTEKNLIKYNLDLLPKFEVPSGFSSEEEYLKKLVKDGMMQKGFINNQVYRDRVKFEMSNIIKCGYTRYFLILWDIINFARLNGIALGIGRGSAAGSLALYVLGVTGVDPIKYNLLFERFINPERISPPDVDLDFDYFRRNEVFHYIERKYGAEFTCKIGTYNTFKPRAVLRYAVKALDLGNDWEIEKKNKEMGLKTESKNSLFLADKIAKQIPEGPNETLDSALKTNPEFQYTAQKYPKLIEVAKKTIGKVSSAGVHAAGIVVCKDEILNHLPLRERDGVLCSQYGKEEVEELGLLKFDCLALKTVTVIDRTLKMVKARKGVEIDIDKIPMNDTKVFDLLNGKIPNMDNRGVFQLESWGMAKLVKDIRVDSIEDIIVANALYRPGPLGAKVPEMYCDYKHGRKPIKPLHPIMGDLLKDTYGLICFGKNQKVFTENGPKKICEIIQKEVLNSFDEKNKKIINQETLLPAINNGKKKVYRYYLTNGYYIDCTPDHLIWDGETYKEIQEMYESKLEMPVKLPSSKIDGDLSFNKEMYFYGAMTGDGGCGRPTPNFCAGHNMEYANYIGNLATDIFGCQYDIRFSTRSWYSHLFFIENKSKFGPNKKNKITDWLKEHSIYCKSIFKKLNFGKIPRNRGAYLSLLAGLIDTDGRVGADIRFSSASSDLLDDVSYLLWSLGYFTYKSNHHLIVINSRMLYKELKNYLVVKNNVEESTICGMQNLRICRKFAKNKVFGLASKEKSANYFCKKYNMNESSAARIMSQKEIINFRSLDTIVSEKEAIDNHVVSIKDRKYLGKDEVWDLSFEKHHNFVISGGFVVHNCYQEDFMKLAQVMAGFTKGESDTLRKYVGKKKEDDLKKQRGKFVDGCIKNGISELIGNQVFDQIEFFGGYGFNRSHSVSYSFLSYQTGWLKYYYPVEFMCNLLSSEIGDEDKLALYLSEAKRMGINILSPHFNKSKKEYVIETVLDKRTNQKVDVLRTPLNFVKGVGEKALDAIVDAQPFSGLKDFLTRVDLRAVNSKVFNSLVEEGALNGVEEGLKGDDIKKRYEECKIQIEKDKKLAKKIKDKDEKWGGGSLFDLNSTQIQI